ncbi:HNH endonuclease signature motif containing protein [Geodermatophilus sp. SYSU D00697]
MTTRDRTCAHPGCAHRAGWAELDHLLRHARGGQTSCADLCCLCRRHHRLKTHARGWTHALTADGTLTVTTPSGITRTGRPPGLRPALPLTGSRVLAGPPPKPPQPPPAPDPPPF